MKTVFHLIWTNLVRRRNGLAVLALFSLLMSTWFGISCSVANRTLISPPHVAGASFVGSTRCADCHTDVAAGFTSATHSWIQGQGANAVEVGCESCHGPGSIHVTSGGAFHTIVNPGRSPETCFQCHQDKAGEFRLPHRHPVLEGRVSCSDCHEPHTGSVLPGGDLHSAAQNDTCFKCHSAQRGPHVFEHEAMREGCTSCHAPHGSVNEKLLKMRGNNVCLTCHAQQQTAPGRILIGQQDHTAFLPRGTCWSSGCHESVHGSRVSSRLRF
jgi:predicted CXXCH cytochrome family protein